MAEATASNKGIVLCRSQIKLEGKDMGGNHKWNDLYICIYKRNKWRWENLHNISTVNFKTYKKNIIDAANISCREFKKHEMPVIIENCDAVNSDYINGIWCPIPEQKESYEFQVYKRSGHKNVWLYPVIGRQNNMDTYQWWIGCFSDFRDRKGWGKCRSNRLPYDGVLVPPPYSVTEWFIWDKVSSNSDENSEKWNWRISKNNFTINTLQNGNLGQMNRINQLKNDFNKMLDIVKELYNMFPKEERTKLIETKLKDCFNKASLCPLCLSIGKPLSKCLHFDCIGACADCRNLSKEGGGGDGTCCACGREQVMECPICIEKHTEQYLKILPCKHCVCWKCFCNSYEVNRPLKKCPSCRHKI